MLKGIVNGVEKDIVRISMKGKNLWGGLHHKGNMVGGSYKYTGSSVTDNDMLFWIPILGGETYTVYITGVFNAVYSANSINEPNSNVSYKINGTSTLMNHGDTNTFTRTTNSEANWLCIHVTTSNFADLKIMINTGSSPLPYEPYYHEGWEVRDDQDRLIWGREDELQTATGTLPFKGYSLPVKVKSLLGNTVQNGTPSPQNIITPEMCGVRTGNIYDKNNPSVVRCYYGANTNTFTPNGQNAFVFVRVEAGKRYFVSGVKRHNTSITVRYCTSFSEPASGVSVVRNGRFAQADGLTIDIESGENYLALFLCGDSDYSAYGSVDSAISANGEDMDINNGWKISFENRGENLFDKNTAVYGEYINENGTVTIEGTQKTAWLSDYIPVTAGSTYTLNRTGSRRGKFYKADKTPYQTATMDFSGLENKNTFTIPETVAFIRFTIYKGDTTPDVIMLNLGSEAKPYSPYLNETIPVYLGEVPTVRRIKKVVFTGQETWTEVYPGEPEAQAQGIVMYATELSELGTDRNDFRCSHFFVGNYRGYLISGQGRINGISPEAFNVNYNNGSGGLQNFKEWLASEYAAGHPVTLWYALATEQTAVVNEPLAKISTYADELTTVPEIPTTTGQNTLTVDSNLAPSSLTIDVHAKKIHYGFKIDKSQEDSESAVIYTHDAVTMTPAVMDFTNDRFDYGSWENAFFVRDCYPVALNPDGTIAYRLDPDDYTKKMDGTPSDIYYELLSTEPSDWSTQWKQYYQIVSGEYVLNDQNSAPTFATDTYYKLTYNSSFTGNFMIAFPKVWFYRHEDSQYNYIEISNHKLSDDWKCYAHINASGQEVDFIYLPMFKGEIVNSKLRSIPGVIPQGGTTATEEVTAASNLGARWQIWDHSSVEMINDLLVLMTKSIDSQGRFGKGRESGYDSTDTVTYGKLQTGTLIKKGKFHGYSSSYKEVKVFGIEGFWANRWDRVQGLLLVNNVWKVKMTPPYNFTGTDFVTLSNAEVPTGNGYLSRIQTSEYGSLPAAIISSSGKYFKDYFYKTATDTRVAIRGGSCVNGGNCGFRCVYVGNAASASYWGIGASPIYK